MEYMKRIYYLIIAAILLTNCAVLSELPTEQPSVQGVNNLEKSAETTPQVKPEPKIVIQDELLNGPPENPRFVIAQPTVVDAAEQVITRSIKRQLLRLGYVEAASRDDANVVIWYSYYSEQTGTRYVGQATDIWGEQLEPVPVNDLSTILLVSFKVQIISLLESRRIWRKFLSNTSQSKPRARLQHPGKCRKES